MYLTASYSQFKNESINLSKRLGHRQYIEELNVSNAIYLIESD